MKTKLNLHTVHHAKMQGGRAATKRGRSTAEYAKHAEAGLAPWLPSAYSAYSAVCFSPDNLLSLRTISTIALQRRREANAVAQVPNLPYRRFPIGSAQFIAGAPEGHAAQTVRAWKGRAGTPLCAAGGCEDRHRSGISWCSRRAAECAPYLERRRVLALNWLPVAVLAGALLGATPSTQAATRYVWQGSPSPGPPYDTWATAAPNIQDAVDAAQTGDTVLVAGGVYATGGRAVGTNVLVNRVAIDRAITVESLMGPEVTIIEGYQVPGTSNGDGAVRCVYLTNGASLSGFTLTNGATRAVDGYPTYRESSGGGVWCESTSAFVTNCVIAGNSARDLGGGTYRGTLKNCALTANSAGSGGGANGSTLSNCTLAGNSAKYGGGAYGGTLNNCVLTGNTALWGGGGASACTLNNCTLTGNSGKYGGGADGGTLNNSIVYFNTAASGANYLDCTLNFCCTTPMPGDGTNNLTLDPQLAGLSHLSVASPCRGAGNAAYATGTDIDGEAWSAPPSIGCDEYHAGAVTGSLSVSIVAAYTNVVPGLEVSFTALIEGRTTLSVWDFGDGIVASNRPYATHAWAALGDYAVVLRGYNESYPGGVSATVVVHVVEPPVHYVAASSANPLPPYTSWATAAASIQDAVDTATVAGSLVLVSNGTYATGGRAISGTMTNRVAVDKLVTLRSVNGPELTLIDGGGLVRCLYLTNGASLCGFTLTNGAADCGGGVRCASATTVVSNCVLTGNSASSYGGGTYGGTLNNCTLSSNSAVFGGGAYGSILYDCALNGNSASSWVNDSVGGGACECVLYNCTLTGNSACTLNYAWLDCPGGGYGGGACGCTLYNCTLTGNWASGLFYIFYGAWYGGYGGGAYESTLNNCTLTGNSANGNWNFGGGGGACGGTLNNCIVYFNTDGGNYALGSSTLNYCCTTPMPADGVGNITPEPQLADVMHVNASSPCRGAGSASYSTGVDIDGEPWANPPSIGCDEYCSGSVTGALALVIVASYTNVSTQVSVEFQGLISGRCGAWRWEFGDGTVVSNRPVVSHAWTTLGDYPVVLRAYNEIYPEGVSATLTIHVVEGLHYVAADSTNPQWPYMSWATAARTIQDAVDAAVIGGTVVVTNGIYGAGGRAVGTSALANRVAVTQLLTVRSVNGPQYTVIQGRQVSGTTNGDGAVRCVYLTNGASLSGFTLTNGATRTTGDHWLDTSGGGVWCESTNAVVTNCVIAGNSAWYVGGGVYSGTLNNCTLTGNSANSGGGAFRGTLNNCTLSGNSARYGGGACSSCSLYNCTLTGNSAYMNGGGAFECTLNNCTLTGNSAEWGGGACGSTLNNCTLAGNYSAGDGGGATGGTLNNCVLTGNWARSGGGAREGTLYNCTLSGNSATIYGGGANGSTLNNCVVYFNTASNGANYYVAQYFGVLNDCCTTPLPTNGVGNITNEPVFADYASGNLHLQSNSPCINAGNNAYVTTTTDLDSRPRIVRGTVDIGAYEFQGSGSVISYAWLQQYGLPTDGSADFTDPDSDGHNNWQEWCCQTDPTNALSVLRLLTPESDGTNVHVRWTSVAGVPYYLLRGTNLTTWRPFQLLATNLPGQAGTTRYTDANAAGRSPLFYRVGVGNYLAPPSPPPPTLTCQYDAGSGTLQLSWSGTGFRLQVQTNSLGVGISTNWFDYPGCTTSPVTVPVDPQNRSVFYRLVWP
jgi:hypothetical protein